jgi:hypothetical protein
MLFLLTIKTLIINNNQYIKTLNNMNIQPSIRTNRKNIYENHITRHQK